MVRRQVMMRLSKRCVTTPPIYVQIMAWSEIARGAPQGHGSNWQPSVACGRPWQERVLAV
jgi:hypothetical protein